MNLPPLTFQPKFVPKIWGGRKLESHFGRELPPGEKIGESWEIYDRPGHSALVADGPLKGASLHQLFLEFGPGLIGERLYEKGPERFPLMVKFIDAAEELSVQVHPDDDYAALRAGADEPGKTEMWVVCQADEGAQVVAGLKPGTDRAAFVEALREEKVERVLNRFKVAEGHAVFVPAGRIHALGKGCLVAEFQQNSDLTYRVYDYKRLENGKPRPLHLQNALEIIRFDPAFAGLPDLVPESVVKADDFHHALLADCPYFQVERIWVTLSFRPAKSRDSFHVLVGHKGRGGLEWQGGSLEIGPGKVVLVPAGLEWELKRATADFEVLAARG